MSRAHCLLCLACCGTLACVSVPAAQAPYFTLPAEQAAPMCAAVWDLSPDAQRIVWRDANNLVERHLSTGQNAVLWADITDLSAAVSYDLTGRYVLHSAPQSAPTVTRIELASHVVQQVTLPEGCFLTRWGTSDSQSATLCSDLSVHLIDWNQPSAAPRRVAAPSLGLAPQSILNNSTGGPTLDGVSQRVAIAYDNDLGQTQLSVWSFAGAAPTVAAHITAPDAYLNTTLPTADAQSVVQDTVQVALNPCDTSEIAPYGLGLFTLSTALPPTLTRMLSTLEGLTVSYTSDAQLLLAVTLEGRLVVWKLGAGQNPMFVGKPDLADFHVATAEQHVLGACTDDGRLSLWKVTSP